MEFYHDGRAPQLQARVRRQAFPRGPIRSWRTGAAKKNARAAPSEISALGPYLAAVPRPLRKIRALERSEEHTSELQSQSNLVCRLLLEKKKKHNKICN